MCPVWVFCVGPPCLYRFRDSARYCHYLVFHQSFLWNRLKSWSRVVRSSFGSYLAVTRPSWVDFLLLAHWKSTGGDGQRGLSVSDRLQGLCHALAPANCQRAAPDATRYRAQDCRYDVTFVFEESFERAIISKAPPLLRRRAASEVR